MLLSINMFPTCVWLNKKEENEFQTLGWLGMSRESGFRNSRDYIDLSLAKQTVSGLAIYKRYRV